MLRNDDELATVNSEYLGPDGYTFPWRARFSAYGIAFILSAVGWWLVVNRLQVPVNLFTVGWLLLVVVLLTRKIGEWITFETPLGALLVMFWHEISGPRTPAAHTSTFYPGRVKIKADGGTEPLDEEPPPGDPVLDETEPTVDPGDDLTAVCQVGLHELCVSGICACGCHRED